VSGRPGVKPSTADSSTPAIVTPGLTAIDLVTIALFAVALRVIWWPIQFMRFLAPFDVGWFYFAVAIAGVPMIRVVRKPGAFVLFGFTQTLIGFIFFGGSWVAWVVNITWSVLADIIYARWLNKVEDTKKAARIAAAGMAAYAACDGVTWFALTYLVYSAKFPLPIYLVALVWYVIVMSTGGYIGCYIGDKLKTLI